MNELFTEAGVGAQLSLKPGESATYEVAGTFTGFIDLELSDSPTTSFRVLVAGAEDTGFSGSYTNETKGSQWLRFRAKDTDGETVITGTAECELSEANETLATITDTDGVARVVTTEEGVAITGTLSVSVGVTGALSCDSTLHVAGKTTTASGVGAKAGATVTVEERGNGVVHQTVLTLTETPLTVTDALAYLGTKVYDFPEGRILVLGSTANLAFTTTSVIDDTINSGAAMDWAVGTSAASNATLANGMVDLVPKVDNPTSTTINVAAAATQGALAASAMFDGTGTAKSAYLNVSFPTGTDIDADGTLTVTGNITLTWINLGDY